MNTIDGLAPLSIHDPADLNELSEAIQQTTARQNAIYPMGGQTMLHLGNSPTKQGVAVDLRHLNQIIDYPARDMTITVQAGITIAALNETLRSEGQRLPIDIPHPDRATLGGSIACNISGPRRLGFGTFRDYVIGISVMNFEGKETKAGGRVVKNVAGYDLCKLYTGSLGTLGIINQVTLKVRPIPETSALVGFFVSSIGLRDTLDRVHSSATRPVCVEVLSMGLYESIVNEPDADAEFLLLLGYEGNSRAVAWQLETIRSELDGIKPGPDWTGPDADSICDALTEICHGDSDQVIFKANLLPSQTGGFCADLLAASGGVMAHAGNGIIYGIIDTIVSSDIAKSMIIEFRDRAVASPGNLVLVRCPLSWKHQIGVWGQPRGDQALMHTVKSKLDPNDTFNPGRLLVRSHPL